MIGRLHRFHGYGGLRAVYQRGKTVRGPLLSLKFSFRDPKHAFRMAVVVSRKVNKSAVVRNRIRRRIYEIVRQQQATLPAGTDLVFTAFSDELANMPQPQLKKTVMALIAKAMPQPVPPGKPTDEAHDIVKPEGN